MNRRTEILAPAGDLTMLRAAINAQANSVYFGVKNFNMRATAKNFELSQLRKVTSICHQNNLKAYLTLNTIIYEDELDKLKMVMEEAGKSAVDAVIAWDMAVITECLKKGMEVHLSTQASVSNFEALKFYAGLGIKRVVLARECTLKQIRSIKNKIIQFGLEVELEAFAHGAMCVSLSGRCFMSQFKFNRSANRGDCLQPCRREYDVLDQATGYRLTVGRDYVLSPKDLCTIQFVDKIIHAGVDTLKIEGRSKTPEYVSEVVSAYKKAVDACMEGSYTDELKEALQSSLERTFNRGFSSGFYMGRPLDSFTDSYGPSKNISKQYVGRVVNYYNKIGVAEIRVDSMPFSIGQTLMIQGPTTGVLQSTIGSMRIEDQGGVHRAEKGQHVGVLLESRVRPGDRVFVINSIGEETEAESTT